MNNDFQVNVAGIQHFKQRKTGDLLCFRDSEGFKVSSVGVDVQSLVDVGDGVTRTVQQQVVAVFQFFDEFPLFFKVPLVFAVSYQAALPRW